MPRVLITGAAGRLGRVLRQGLVRPDRTLRFTDRATAPDRISGEDWMLGDLSDAAFAMKALRDVDAVIHAAGIPDEAPFDELLSANVSTTLNVFEAARHNGVAQVIYASSAHVAGFYPRGQEITPGHPIRPDTVYGVTKAFGEALGSLYADKHRIAVVSLRIGSFRDRPEDERQLWTWLSKRDAVHLVDRCLDAPQDGHTIFYGVSNNTRRWWADDSRVAIGYKPADDAEHFAHLVPPTAAPSNGWQGGVFADPAYAGGAG